MARSHSIYIVFNPDTDRILGAFTVKHEMLDFVRRCGLPNYCLQFRDNQPQLGNKPVKIPYDQF